MPSSHPYQLNEITELIRATAPLRMLDVGIGFGKYGFLAREYLELWDGRQQYSDWQRRIDGVEIFPQFVTPLQRYIYNEIYIGDAREILSGLPDKAYDLVLLVDILEHFDREHGLEVLNQAARVGRNVLASTPRDIGHQGANFGNPHERHVFQWRKDDFRRLGPHFFVPNRRSLIWYGGDAAARVNRERLSGHFELPGLDLLRGSLHGADERWRRTIGLVKGQLRPQARRAQRSIHRAPRTFVRGLRSRFRNVPWMRWPYVRLRSLARRLRSALSGG